MTKTGIGVRLIRKEAWSKVTGQAKYAADLYPAGGCLSARLVTSTCAHAKIRKIDFSQAAALPGVEAVLTGDSFTYLCGPQLEDRPPLAREKVRYYGEPVALVVAKSEFEAAKAVSLIQVEYEPLPAVLSPAAALAAGAPILHENLDSYRKAVEDVYPAPGTNVCDRKKSRKGVIAKGFMESQVIVESHFVLPQSDHAAMETHAARAGISADGTVHILSATQAPFEVKKMISKIFQVEQSKVIVEVPFVGGGFGGKAPVQLEILAYMASMSVSGREVRLVNTRENDMASSPCRLGLEATIKLGATRAGLLKAAQMTFLVDTGGYADIGPTLAKAMAVDGTGPYHVENVCCDALCIYTNHPYATSFRGFGHAEYTFCIERMMDKLAHALQMDPAKVREKNALLPGHTSPTQVKVTSSNLGNLPSCIERVMALINWSEGSSVELGGNKVRAKGMACLWKTSNSPTDAVSGALLTFNADGSINLNCGCVEIGPAMKTTAAQILSETLKMDVNRIHVNMHVNTEYNPEHWKTVASMTTYMLGRAVVRAGEDAARQLKNVAAMALKQAPEDLDVEDERVFVRQDPSIYMEFKDLVHGYQYPGGNSMAGQILGRGTFIMSDLNQLDKETGRGKSGPAWTVGAQAVEIEFDRKEFTYRFIKAATVLDAGRVLNPPMAEGLVKGGMCMGLGLASREYYSFDGEGRMLNTSLRNYKVMHFAEQPQYLVGFVETPQIDAPYQARGIAEHGIIGMPAALGNALSLAAGVELDTLPLTPETIWRKAGGGA